MQSVKYAKERIRSIRETLYGEALDCVNLHRLAVENKNEYEGGFSDAWKEMLLRQEIRINGIAKWLNMDESYRVSEKLKQEGDC